MERSQNSLQTVGKIGIPENLGIDFILLVFLNFFRYASLYFCCAVEQTDNELVTLEVIHRYVELLDKYFGSVSSF